MLDKLENQFQINLLINLLNEKNKYFFFWIWSSSKIFLIKKKKKLSLNLT